MLLKGETANVNRVIEKLKTIEDYEEDVMNAAQQLKQQGREEGRHEGELSLAKKLLDRGIDLELIKSASGFSEQELIELEKV
jgi:recombination-promoting nuclease RpnB